MQAFSGDARVPKSQLIVAAMLDLQNLGLRAGERGGEGAGMRGKIFLLPFPLPSFSFQTYPLPLGCSFYSPQSSSSFKIQDGGYSVRSPPKYACIAGYFTLDIRCMFYCSPDISYATVTRFSFDLLTRTTK